MNQKRRTQAIQEFQSSAADSPTIMLLSLKAGGVGLNLTAASHVFLMDPVRTDSSNSHVLLGRGLFHVSKKGKTFSAAASLGVHCVFQAWNPATEEQCIDRCHRLGQERNVVVTKVTGPERLLCLKLSTRHPDVVRLKAVGIVHVLMRFSFFMLCAAVHCEGFGGGEDGGHPEEEAGPGGEGFRLHGQRSENISDR